MNTAIKTLFLGTNWESLRFLEVLDQDPRFEITGVITPIDKPVGRKKVLTPTPVKEYAIKHKIPVIHTEKQKEKYQEALDLFTPDLVVCIAFGEIAPEFFLETPQFKAINIHFSVLPEYRGAVPIQKSLLNGDRETGISVVKMVKELDAGPVLKIFPVDILPEDTNQTLRERLVAVGCEIICDTLDQWCDGKIETVEQDHEKATFCYQSDISKENAEINWANHSPIQIERMCRALQPWPISWCMYGEQRMKVFSVKIQKVSELLDFPSLKAGEFYLDKSGTYVGSSESEQVIEILELQLEGRNRMSGKQFSAGNISSK